MRVEVLSNDGALVRSFEFQALPSPGDIIALQSARFEVLRVEHRESAEAEQLFIPALTPVVIVAEQKAGS